MKQYHNNVIPECFADTVLVEMLGFNQPNHALNSCVSSVLKTVKNSRPAQMVVGIIDSDRGKSEKLLDEFELVAEEHGIKKFIREKQTVLVLCPAFEGWVFQNATEKNISPEKHGFATQKSLEKAAKSYHAKKDGQLKNFFGLLKIKQAPGFVQLKTWICEGAGIDENDL